MRFDTKAAVGRILTLLLLLAAGTVAAQEGKQPWEEYEKLINKRKAVTTLGADMFGDQVDLASGDVSFSQTDISLPGNNALPVALTRTFRVKNDKDPGRYSFSDWDIDIPSISGLFASSWHDDRCDRLVPPTVPVYSTKGSEGVSGDRYWKGTSSNMPNGGELLRILPTTPVRATGGPYKWITPGRTLFKCLPTIANGTGQGFEAITPDGTKYTFNYLAGYAASSMQHTWQIPHLQGQPAAYTSGELKRNKFVLYATRVEDRFGNWVNYSYNNTAGQPFRIASITASDGRQITFTYNANNRIQSATAAGRTWTYAYDDGTLTDVVQPDGSKWDIAFGALSQTDITYLGAGADPNWRSCFFNGAPDLPAVPYSGTITHPSGAVGKFTLGFTFHARTNVPAICENWIPKTFDPPWNDPTNDYAIFPIRWHALSLAKKEISGPGLPAQTWTFTYASQSSYFIPDGADEPYKCNSITCADPICLSDACAGKAWTTVVGPDGWKKYTFGNSYRYNEGKLLKIEEGPVGGPALRTTTKTYDLAQSGQPYPVQVGESELIVADSFTAEFPRPEVSTVVTQQDVDFTRSVETGCAVAGQYCLDNYLRPTRSRRFSSLGYTTTEATEYYDNTTLWVLGQVKKVTEVGTGTVIQQTGFDGATALPLQQYRYGLLQHTLTYNADGTLATVKDGRNNVTTLSAWKRGVPQTIAYPGATPVYEKANVNDSGDITWTEDELASRTSYGYDAIGRLTAITYPAGDIVAWNGTTLPFEKVTTAVYGIQAGQWKQTVKTGTGQTTTFYDAQWRPVLVLTEDTALAASKSFVVTKYNPAGQVSFTSYPVAAVVNLNTDALKGTYTDYDALGRPIGTRQDSEFANALTTTTEYLTGFQTRTTNARGFKTNTRYQVFDTPDTSRPVLIQSPEGVNTTIARDVFGMPTAVTRSGPGG